MISPKSISTIVRLEISRNLKAALLWSLLLSGLAVMGLAFYPALSGAFSELERLFSNPLMAGMLAAFGADAAALTSLTGFYVTYGSIYVTLLGCIYAGLLGARRIAEDEADGVAEYLLTRPVTRTGVYLGKIAAMAILLLVVNVLVLAGSIFALEVFGRGAPFVIYPHERTVQSLADQIEDRPNAMKEVFDLDRELFDEVAAALARNELGAASASEIAAAGVDPKSLSALLSKLQTEGPAGLVADIKENPAEYRELMGLTSMSMEEFRAHVDDLARNLDALWTQFQAGGAEAVDMFRQAPVPFIRQLAAEPGRDDPGAESGLSARHLSRELEKGDLPGELARRLVVRYPRESVIELGVYTFLAMWVFACLAIAASSLSRKPETATIVALLFVLVAYFVDVITQAVGAEGAFAFASPFAMIDERLMRGSYGLTAGRLIYFLVISTVAAAVGLVVFREKDIRVP
jgi:ABC-type transport system involved in multi-copper enzyme maturation permease subunit